MADQSTGNLNPAVLYLRDVLGVRGLPNKTPNKTHATHTKVPNDSGIFDVAVITARALTTEEKALAEKMLAAIDYHNIAWMCESAADLNTCVSASRGVVLFGEMNSSIVSNEVGNDHVLKLPDLSEFFGSEQKVQALKKSTWNQLKKFKLQMSESAPPTPGEIA